MYFNTPFDATQWVCTNKKKSQLKVLQSIFKIESLFVFNSRE